MKDMPCEPDAALLGASRIQGNTELGEKAAEMIFRLEPWNAEICIPFQEEMSYTLKFKHTEQNGRKPPCLKIGVLSACGHTSLFDKGMEHFYSMARDYGIVTNTRQYTCIIDLLGRAGRLDDKQNLMIDMSCEPDVATWATLQGASRIHGTPN
ncbi:hypothetical protein MTR67_015531 [Solanum verrucosum]|uniref:Pentatricopeptide repeat-containing protein n=1 Tax=Solanum verrucosum TaxID=315347 RepID=A0AAF0TK01_SOLVR|nr:hypothetical protein MTR67_015531 [Solanum verrucosum]